MSISITQNELAQLLCKDEGQFLEFKSLWDREGGKQRLLPRRKVRDWIAEYVAAFANADGGTIILGVEDDGTPSGCKYPKEAVRGFLDVPARRLRPAVSVRGERVSHAGQELIVIEVPMHPEAVMVEGGGFPCRVGHEVVLEPQEVINDRKQSYRRVGYEQRVRRGTNLDDLDMELARRFLLRTVHKDRRVEEALELYGLTTATRTGVALTNAALLLFGKEPMARWHPRAGIRFFRVRGTTRNHGKRRNVAALGRLELPLARAIEEAHAFASQHIRRSEKLHNLFFREMPEYPEFAWQEAVVNAFAHRDYNDRGREIEVWFYEDRMEVTNPGDLVPPITLDQLRQRRRVHASRNPLLVRVLADAGIMREEGEGIPRIFEEMEDAYLNPPELQVEASQFQVTLYNRPILEAGSPGWQRMVDRLALRTSQKRVLVAFPEGFTNEDYRNLSGGDRDHAYREIQEMVAKGVVASPGSAGRGAVYRLSPALRDMRAWLEARIPAVQEHFQRHAKLTNRQYREIFGVTRHAATRELRALSMDGFLELAGQRRGAHYLPGPALSGTGTE